MKKLFGEEVNVPLSQRHVGTSEPEGNDLKRFKDFDLKVKARIWP